MSYDAYKGQALPYVHLHQDRLPWQRWQGFRLPAKAGCRHYQKSIVDMRFDQIIESRQMESPINKTHKQAYLGRR